MKKMYVIHFCNDYRLTENGTWKHDEFMWWTPDDPSDPDSHLTMHEDKVSRNQDALVKRIKQQYPGALIKEHHRNIRDSYTEEEEKTVREAKQNLIDSITRSIESLRFKGFNDKQIKALLHEFNSPIERFL